MHTPRLCIDARAALEFPFQGLVAQEAIDQLVLANGENGLDSEWIAKHRTVLLSHDEQVFSGQFKRFNTRIKMGKSPIHWAYAQSFLKKASVSGLHEFRPVDKLLPTLHCPTVTTLLPPRKALPFLIARKNNHRYIVPSTHDSELLTHRYQIQPSQIIVFRPFIRRYTHFAEAPKRNPEGMFLFLTDVRFRRSHLKEMVSLLSKRYHGMVTRVVYLDRMEVAPTAWSSLLEKTRVVFYLTARPFDWATLALESIYWGIPTFFPDKNSVLNEVLPQSPLKLSHFLVNTPKLNTLEHLTATERRRLEDQGIFDPTSLARQYRQVYADIDPTN